MLTYGDVNQLVHVSIREHVREFSDKVLEGGPEHEANGDPGPEVIKLFLCSTQLKCLYV